MNNPRAGLDCIDIIGFEVNKSDKWQLRVTADGERLEFLSPELLSKVVFWQLIQAAA